MAEMAATQMRKFGPHRPARTVVEMFEELFSYGGVLRNIAGTQIHAQYRGSFLGILWTVLGPLTMLAVYTAVFGTLIGRNVEHFALYLISGMVPFIAFQQCCVGGCRTFINGEVYMRRVYLPKLLFPTVTVAVQFVGFLCTCTAVLLLAPFLHAKLSIHWVTLPLSIALLFLFCYGMVMIFAVVNVYFPDMEHIIAAALRALYFLTPIIYKPEPPLPEAVIAINMANPMTYFLFLFRAPLYENAWPEARVWMTVVILALASFVIGLSMLRAFQNKLIYAM